MKKQKTRIKLTDSLKLRLWKAYQEGTEPSKLAKDFCVSIGTVRNIIRKYRLDNIDQRTEEMEKQEMRRESNPMPKDEPRRKEENLDLARTILSIENQVLKNTNLIHELHRMMARLIDERNRNSEINPRFARGNGDYSMEKPKTGKLSEKQKAFIERITKSRGIAFMATGLDDVYRHLREAGIKI